MADLARTARITAEDLPYLAPEEGLCELVAGEIVREPAPGEEHGWVAGNLLALLGHFVREHRLGRFYAAETGFVVARGPDTVRAPDAAFVSYERLATTIRRGPYFEGAPDLAVEVLSPSNTRAEMAAKVRDFLAAGARAVWVVDPSREEVTVHRPGRPPETLSRTDTLDAGSAVPGFRLPVRDIFEG
jgi:Uma2 family endonuclease